MEGGGEGERETGREGLGGVKYLFLQCYPKDHSPRGKIQPLLK